MTIVQDNFKIKDGHIIGDDGQIIGKVLESGSGSTENGSVTINNYHYVSEQTSSNDKKTDEAENKTEPNPQDTPKTDDTDNKTEPNSQDTLSDNDDTDPTQPYSITPRSLCEIDISDLENKYNLLNAEKVMLISCYDKEVAINAVHKLISKMDSYSKRQLELKKFLNKDEHHPYRTWEQLSQTNFGWEKSTIIFFDAYHISAQLLLEELIFSHVETSNLRTNLKDNDRLIVCLVEQENLDILLGKNPNIDSQLALWKLDYLKPLLACESDAEELCQTIQAQSQQGLWGKTPKEIYANIKGYHQNGTLREYIQKLETNSETTQNPIEIVSRSKDIQAVELFDNSSPMEKIVLFVAVYFPNLTYEYFKQLVLFFLENQTRTETKASKKKKPKQSKKYKKKTSSDGENPIQLSDDWFQQDEDETLHTLHLKIRTGEDEKEIIDFELPYLRTDLKRYLSEKKPAFLRKQADFIRYSKFIFIDDIEVLDNVIQLLVIMAKKNPTHYGRVWLANLVFFIEQDRKNFRADKNNPLSILDEMFKNEIKREHDLVCVAKIIMEMLNHDPLVSIVNGFFDDLFKADGDQYNEVIFDLAKYLRYAPNFDELSYMRRLSHQTKDNSQFQNWIQGFLQSYLRKSGGLYDSIAKLSQWLPQNTLPDDQCQPHQLMAFNAFFNLILNATSRGELEEESYGQWPSRYLLFRALETERISQNIGQIMIIIAHNGTENILQEGWIEQLEKFLQEEWMRVMAFQLNQQILSPHIAELAKSFMKEVSKGTFNNSHSYAALLMAFLIGKWRIILQGDLKTPMSADAAKLYKVIQTCFYSLDSQFKKQVYNSLNTLKAWLIQENTLLREILIFIEKLLGNSNETKMLKKIKIQIGQQLTMRTNHLIRLRKDLIDQQ